ncbi:MAG: hypothetical protein MI741_16445 [Rhodospirillales bacterium]|nr:hypothetical protein [Rhodospirillales bacterium]
MTALEFCDRLYARRARIDWLKALSNAWRAFLSRRRDRRTIVTLSRLDPRHIRDAGFDPDLIYEALDGSWDEVEPGRFHNRLPGRDRL